MVQWYKQYKTVLNWKCLQFLQKCQLKFEWYRSTNSTKLLRPENLCKFWKILSYILSSTVVQTVQNLYKTEIMTIFWKMSFEIWVVQWYKRYKTILNWKYLQFLEKCQLKFEWYSGTNGTKLLRTENLCKLWKMLS